MAMLNLEDFSSKHFETKNLQKQESQSMSQSQTNFLSPLNNMSRVESLHGKKQIVDARYMKPSLHSQSQNKLSFLENEPSNPDLSMGLDLTPIARSKSSKPLQVNF